MRLVAQVSRMLDLAMRDEAPLGGIVPTAHGDIHYLADGPKRGLPMVLLHGASGNLRDWSMSMLPVLARSGPAIAFDRPGFGQSRPVRGPVWELGVQVAALREALHTMGHRRYLLIGHSYSGALALDWALRHPDEVAGLCVLSGATMDWGGDLTGHYRVTSMPVIGRLVSRMAPLIATERRIRATLEEIFEPQAVPPIYRETARVELALRPQTFRINARAMHELHEQIVANEPRYPEIDRPVEIVHGAADTVVPAEVHAVPLSRALPAANLTLLPGIGHMPHHAAPREVLAAIQQLRERARSSLDVPLA